MAKGEGSDLHRPNDPSAMTEAINWFLARGLRVRRVSPFQLKFGRLNYYPTQGTMNYDSQERLRSNGLKGLEYVLCKIFRVESLPIKKHGEGALGES